MSKEIDLTDIYTFLIGIDEQMSELYDLIDAFERVGNDIVARQLDEMRDKIMAYVYDIEKIVDKLS